MEITVEKPEVPESANTTQVITTEELKLLRDRVAAKEEKLRKLKLVQMYRKKWSMEELSERVEEWKSVAQRALLVMFNKLKQGAHPDLTIEKYLEHLNVSPEFIGYNVQDETFE